MHYDQKGWIDQYVSHGAYWFHDGNPNRPHVRMRAGQHSNGFFNSRLVISDGPLITKAAEDLVEKLMMTYDIGNIDVVVGPQTGATKLAEKIANRIGFLRNRPCRFASPQKTEIDGKPGAMVFNDPQHKIRQGDMAIMCEDVGTTFGSVERAATATKEAGGIIAAHVLVLVNRSEPNVVNGRRIIALIHTPMSAWDPDNGECELCQIGSPLITEVKKEWDKLTAEYQPT